MRPPLRPAFIGLVIACLVFSGCEMAHEARLARGDYGDMFSFARTEDSRKDSTSFSFDSEAHTLRFQYARFSRKAPHYRIWEDSVVLSKEEGKALVSRVAAVAALAPQTGRPRRLVHSYGNLILSHSHRPILLTYELVDGRPPKEWREWDAAMEDIFSGYRMRERAMAHGVSEEY